MTSILSNARFLGLPAGGIKPSNGETICEGWQVQWHGGDGGFDLIMPLTEYPDAEGGISLTVGRSCSWLRLSQSIKFEGQRGDTLRLMLRARRGPKAVSALRLNWVALLKVDEAGRMVIAHKLTSHELSFTEHWVIESFETRLAEDQPRSTYFFTLDFAPEPGSVDLASIGLSALGISAVERVVTKIGKADPTGKSQAQPSVETLSTSEKPIQGFTCLPSGLGLRGTGEMAVVAITLDGESIPVSPRPVPGGLDVSLPQMARDGQEHVVEATIVLDGEQHRVKRPIQSHYIGFVDHSAGCVFGWIYDAADPGHAVSLDVEVDGDVFGPFRTGLVREDVATAGHVATRPGFNIPLPALPSLNRPRLAVLRIAGTGYAPLGSFLCDITPNAYTTLPPSPKPGAQTLLRDRFVTPRLIGLARAPQESRLAFPLGMAQVAGPAWRRAERPIVDVVIPVYRGLEETLDCVNSVLRSRGDIETEIIVIDDCSPEPTLTEALVAIAQKGHITYVRNSKNIGFVSTVNLGMRRHPQRDVVLLNADTVVPPGWIDRLYDAAYADLAIATATALSNNATICSLPRIGGTEVLPYRATLEQIDAVCQQVNAGTIVDLPTAHGFCMFIKREALNDIGFFDEVTFTRGYAEENDFSLRAAARGWRNVAACDVFVQHKGSVSFQDEATLLKENNLKTLVASYPDYHRQVMAFLLEDPLHAARNRVQMAFWRGKRIVVLVTLALGGGVDRHVADTAASLIAGGALVLVLARSKSRATHAYELHAWGDEESALLYPAVKDAAVLAIDDIITLAPAFLHVHHVLDTELDLGRLIAASGLPYQVTLHDYFYVCPRVTLMDDSHRYCGLPAPSKCEQCLGRGGAHDRLDPSFAGLAAEPTRWRANWAAFLAGASQRFAPSADTAAHYKRAFPHLDIEVLPHEAPSPGQVTPEARPAPARIEVLILGAIGPHKGIERLLDLLGHAERWAEDVHFTVLGFTSADERVQRFNNVTVTGPYTVDELASRIQSLGAHVALFLSPWPETYSYTLSETLAQGITPLAYDIGAIAERLRSLGCGILRPLDSPAPVMLDAVREAAALSTPAVAFFPVPAALPAQQTEGEVVPPVLVLRVGRGFHPDGWASRRVCWTLRLAGPVEWVEVELWLPADFAGQFVSVLLDGRPVLRRKLEAGNITSLIVPGGLPGGLATLACEFDFDVKLPGADQRRASAVVRALTMRLPGFELAWKPSDGMDAF